MGHSPARIQLKAIARVADRILDCPVPLYRVSGDMLTRVREGKAVPHSCILGPSLTDPSLEDFALRPDESVQAKECEELPAVLDYIRANQLDAAAL